MIVGDDLKTLVKGAVKRVLIGYESFDLDKEELLSEGYLICCEQIPKYKPSTGCTLNNYLYQQVTFRLKNYITRVALKHLYGTEQMVRVSMDNVDREVSLIDDHETTTALNEFRLSLEPAEAAVFDALRVGYTYRQISESTGRSIGSITNMVKRWGKI